MKITSIPNNVFSLFACAYLLAPALAQAALDDELNALYKKYGRDSVVRKVERDNPRAVEAAQKTKVPEDALAPKQESTQERGFRLFKEQPFPFLFRRSYSEVTSDEDRSNQDPKDSVRLTERSEEHTSELQSLRHLVCRLLLEKKKTKTYQLLAGARLTNIEELL